MVYLRMAMFSHLISTHFVSLDKFDIHGVDSDMSCTKWRTCLTKCG